jgi:K+-sensing histidine kinase KdpD
VLMGWVEKLEKTGREGLPPGSAAAYLLAGACAGAAAIAHILFLQFTSEIMPSIFYNPAVFAAALFGGITAGAAAAGLSIFFLWLIFNWLYAAHQLVAASPVLTCALYLVAAVVIVWIADRYRASGRRNRSEAGDTTAADAAALASRPLTWSAAMTRLRDWYADPRPNPLAGYIVAVVCIFIATLIRFGFGWLGGELLPLVSYYPGILLAALVGGAGPGVLAMILSLLAVWLAFPAPVFSFGPLSREESVSLSVYVFVSLLSIWLAENRRAVSADARESRMLEWATPVLVAFAAVLLTTFALLAIDSYLGPDHLVIGYLLPTVVIAMHYGSTLAVVTSFAGGLAAAYFLFPPKLSFYIGDPLNLAELGFFLLLAVIASKAVAVVTDDIRTPDLPTRRSGRIG